MYDFVGDIHGYAENLKSSLKALGYNQQNGVWSHPTRKLFSVGDLVDKGPLQKEVVDIVKSMHEADSAQVIMGNHEFNAVAYYLKNESGEYLRPHTKSNRKQHLHFLKAAEADLKWYTSTIEWFMSLPLFVETDSFRCIHAAWDDAQVDYLKTVLNEDLSLPRHQWVNATTKGHLLYEAIEHCLKGPEIDLPEGISFIDKGDKKRTNMRLKWWSINEQSTYRNAAVTVPNVEQLPDIPLQNEHIQAAGSSTSSKPTFFGHYWMDATAAPHVLDATYACLDWACIANGKTMVTYRFDDEQTLDNAKLHFS